MRPLETEFRKAGYDYAQVYRSETAAVYSQASDGKIFAYEAIEIIKAKEAEVFGKMQPKREVYPSTEMWGTRGFTLHTLEKAIRRAKEIEKTVAGRVSSQEGVEAVLGDHV